MPKVLLVEDNEFNRDALTRHLTRRGFEVISASHGVEGLALASRERPDLILMDMGLPDLDGQDATRLLRQDEATAGIPVIALTAHAMNVDREEALASGCDDFETKPVDVSRLVEKIHALLKRGAERT